MHTVYALVDPRDNKVHYVGITDDVYKRFIAHISGGAGSNYEKNAWVHEMRDAGVMIRMDTLEQTENIGYAHVRELYWINHFTQLRHPLTNKARKIPKIAYKVLVRSSPTHSPKANIAAIEDAFMVEPPQDVHLAQSAVQGTPVSMTEVPQSIPTKVIDEPPPNYPLMDEVQISQFITLYPMLGIEKSLDQIKGCAHRHRIHARVLVNAYSLQRKRG